MTRLEIVLILAWSLMLGMYIGAMRGAGIL